MYLRWPPPPTHTHTHTLLLKKKSESVFLRYISWILLWDFGYLKSYNITVNGLSCSLQIDNHGNSFLLKEEASLNVPAIAAAHVIKRYTAQASDEISIEVLRPVHFSPLLIYFFLKQDFEIGYMKASSFFKDPFSELQRKFQSLSEDLVPSLSSLFFTSCPYSAHACTTCLVLGHCFVLSALPPPPLPPPSCLFLSPLPICCSIYSDTFWAREWGDPILKHIEAPFLSLFLFVSLFLSFFLSLSLSVFLSVTLCKHVTSFFKLIYLFSFNHMVRP